jgi:hypothetical protein
MGGSGPVTRVQGKLLRLPQMGNGLLNAPAGLPAAVRAVLPRRRRRDIAGHLSPRLPQFGEPLVNVIQPRRPGGLQAHLARPCVSCHCLHGPGPGGIGLCQPMRGLAQVGMLSPLAELLPHMIASAGRDLRCPASVMRQPEPPGSGFAPILRSHRAQGFGEVALDPACCLNHSDGPRDIRQCQRLLGARRLQRGKVIPLSAPRQRPRVVTGFHALPGSTHICMLRLTMPSPVGTDARSGRDIGPCGGT